MANAAAPLRSLMSCFGMNIETPQVRVIKAGASKNEALDVLIDAVSRNPAVEDPEAFRKAIYAREAVTSTGIGGGVAIPHVRIPEISQVTLGVGIVPDGVPFDALDNQPVHVIVLFATPKGTDKEYLGLLAQVMLALRNRALFDELVACQTPEEVAAVLNRPD